MIDRFRSKAEKNKPVSISERVDQVVTLFNNRNTIDGSSIDDWNARYSSSLDELKEAVDKQDPRAIGHGLNRALITTLGVAPILDEQGAHFAALSNIEDALRVHNIDIDQLVSVSDHKATIIQQVRNHAKSLASDPQHSTALQLPSRLTFRELDDLVESTLDAVAPRQHSLLDRLARKVIRVTHDDTGARIMRYNYSLPDTPHGFQRNMNEALGFALQEANNLRGDASPAKARQASEKLKNKFETRISPDTPDTIAHPTIIATYALYDTIKKIADQEKE